MMLYQRWYQGTIPVYLFYSTCQFSLPTGDRSSRSRVVTRWYPCWGSLLRLQEQLLCPEPRHPAHPVTSRDKSAWVQPPVGYRLARSTEVTSQVDTPVLSTCVPRQRCHAVQVRWTCAALAIANQNLVDLRSPGPAPQKTFSGVGIYDLHSIAYIRLHTKDTGTLSA